MDLSSFPSRLSTPPIEAFSEAAFFLKSFRLGNKLTVKKAAGNRNQD